MGNSYVGIWWKCGQDRGCESSEVGVNLARVNDNKEAVVEEESGREGRVIRNEVKEVMRSSHEGP